MIRQALLSLSRQKKIAEISANAPVTRNVVTRFVAGETEQDDDEQSADHGIPDA